MFAKQTVAAMLAAFVLVAAVGPVAAAGGQANSSITATVQMTDDATLITYEENGEAATNAEMTIETVGEASFEGSGTYTTDENGTVELPAPDDSTTVLLSVDSDTVQATATVDLQAPETEPVETIVSFDTDASSDDGSAQMAGSATGASGDDAVQADSGTDAQSDLSFVQQMLRVFIPGYDVVVESGAQASSGDDVQSESSGDATAQSGDATAQSGGDIAASDEGDAAQADAAGGAEADADGEARAAADGDAQTDEASVDADAESNDDSFEGNAESSSSTTSDGTSTEAAGSGSGDVSDDTEVDLGANGAIAGDA